MRKISLFAGVVALTLGLGAVSATSSAFADTLCLNPDAGTIDLSHDAMKPGAGWGYDKAGVDAELAKGNRCAVTQQSQPIDQTHYSVKSRAPQSTYN
jgi:hypothetical protein